MTLRRQTAHTETPAASVHPADPEPSTTFSALPETLEHSAYVLHPAIAKSEPTLGARRETIAPFALCFCFLTAAQPRARSLCAAIALCLLLPLTGCFLRKPKAAAIPPPPPVVATETVSIPPPTHPTEPEPEPEVVEAPPVVLPPPPAPKKPSRRRPAPPTPAPPVATATAEPPIELGQLTTGGDANNTALRQGTEDLLRAQQRRIIALPSATAAAHIDQVERARLFLRDADEAWKKLDLEGTRTLATKAKVILDEITQ